MEAGAVRNADEWFKLMVDTGLAPGLRALGMSGSGRHFRVIEDAHIGQVSILQSSKSSAYSTRFTMSLSVTATDEWATQLRIRPYTGRHPGGGWQERIGNLMLIGSGIPIGDLWWKIEAGKPFAGLSDEVLTAVREFGLPAIRDQIRARVH
ncbi:DUF4304 domain-containing protein [Actinokineospora inagensis]|uniref:DUF4304 domain-containing protein n=1 Tax=Actinokineospora inagensis TaxID=103730 RepID=UPI00041B8AFF|nr:DUF4304 domain-containing protein [Actinokineospora inagensis]